MRIPIVPDVMYVQRSVYPRKLEWIMINRPGNLRLIVIIAWLAFIIVHKERFKLSLQKAKNVEDITIIL